MTRILGIDPGSRITGYGVIDFHGDDVSYVDSGCIRVSGEDTGARLRCIYEGVSEIVSAYDPREMAAEQVFVHRNPASALKLGQARGAAIVACVVHRVAVFEYMPNEIKRAITGQGHAAKEQVQHMIRVLLRLSRPPLSDAADALAVAVCHGHVRRTRVAMGAAAGAAPGAELALRRRRR